MYAKGFDWFGRAASQGNAAAQATLGWMYADGHEGVQQDFAQAVNWFGKAANQGNAYAEANLAVLYADGDGAPQDYTRALMWSTLALAGAEDGETRGLAIKVRDALADKITTDQIAEAQRMAREWLPK
jgi:uncharacterized protein